MFNIIIRESKQATDKCGIKKREIDFEIKNDIDILRHRERIKISCYIDLNMKLNFVSI